MFAFSCSILGLSRLMALWLGRDIFAVVQDRLVVVVDRHCEIRWLMLQWVIKINLSLPRRTV